LSISEICSAMRKGIERGLQDCEADFDAVRRHRKRRGKRRWIDINAVAVEVVLGKEDRVGAELFGHLRFADRLVDDLVVLRRIARLGKEKHTNFHCPLVSG
jgi:hypothetical protein